MSFPHNVKDVALVGILKNFGKISVYTALENRCEVFVPWLGHHKETGVRHEILSLFSRSRWWSNIAGLDMTWVWPPPQDAIVTTKMTLHF